jgi:hypothetical protein
MFRVTDWKFNVFSLGNLLTSFTFSFYSLQVSLGFPDCLLLEIKLEKRDIEKSRSTRFLLGIGHQLSIGIAIGGNGGATGDQGVNCPRRQREGAPKEGGCSQGRGRQK